MLPTPTFCVILSHYAPPKRLAGAYAGRQGRQGIRLYEEARRDQEEFHLYQ